MFRAGEKGGTDGAHFTGACSSVASRELHCHRLPCWPPPLLAERRLNLHRFASSIIRELHTASGRRHN
ncbi:hypothetical protein SESBI_18326 [Sesbania bispinosa]|nr:hypothetical protein SESBI_18326 [Sesbania bispinosa]